MNFFLRYTSNPQADLERGESYHASGISENQCSKIDISEMFGCCEDDIILLDNGLFNNGKENGDMCYFQKLDGLCGFELLATTIEDAIEEAKKFQFNAVYNSQSMGDIVCVFEGQQAGHCEEGVLFTPFSLVYYHK